MWAAASGRQAPGSWARTRACSPVGSGKRDFCHLMPRERGLELGGEPPIPREASGGASGLQRADDAVLVFQRVTAFTLRKKSAVRTDKSPPYFQPSRMAVPRCPHLLSGMKFPGAILVTAVGLRAGRCLHEVFLENTGPVPLTLSGCARCRQACRRALGGVPLPSLWGPALQALGAPATPAREASSLNTSEQLVVCLCPPPPSTGRPLLPGR